MLMLPLLPHAGIAGPRRRSAGVMPRAVAWTVALAVLMLGAERASATEDPPCWPAIDAMATALPELVPGVDARLGWRGLPVEIACRGRDIAAITVRWSAAAPGTLSDARSAIAALGARLTADSATAVRGAVDRCVASAGHETGPQRATTSRSILACSVSRDAASFTVQRRGDEG